MSNEHGKSVLVKDNEVEMFFKKVQCDQKEAKTVKIIQLCLEMLL